MSVAALKINTRLLGPRDLWRTVKAHRAFIILLVLALLVRLILAPFAIFPHDPQYYVNWGYAAQQHFLTFYSSRPDAEYPPLAIYVFAIIDALYSLVAHLYTNSPTHSVTASTLLISLVKVPPILADLGAVIVLYAVARRVLSNRGALLLAASYAFSPFVLSVGALWGQQDNVYAFPALLAFLFALRRQNIWAGVMCAIAVMLKPQPIIFVPVILVYIFRWAGMKQSIRFLAGFAGMLLLICLPYLLPPDPQVLVFVHNVRTLRKPVPGHLALNLWFLLGAARLDGNAPVHWMSALNTAKPYIGPLTASTVGLVLFTLCLIIVAAGIWRDKSPRTFLFGGGIVGLAFFVVTTEQRERYMFPALLLFVAATIYEKRYGLVYVVATTLAFINFLVYTTLSAYGYHLEAYLGHGYHYIYAHWSYLDVLSMLSVELLIVALVMYVRDLGRQPLARDYSPYSKNETSREFLRASVLGAEDTRSSIPAFTATASFANSSASLNLTELSAKLGSKIISVVIPCYNEQDNITPMYERLTATLRPLTNVYELIFINNGSYDGSAPVFKALADADPHVSVLTLSRNFGSQGAYTCGLEYASGDGVICIDGDIQDPPELIPALLEKWLEGYEVVYGVRVRRKGSLIRRIGYKAFYRLFRRFSYIDMPVDAGDFGLIDRRVVNVMNAMPERNRFIRGLRAWAGFRQTGVPYVRQERHAGKTTNSLIGLFRWAGMGLVSFSYAPLDLISFLAIGVVGLSAVALIVYMVLYFVSPGAPRGFQTLLVIILFLGSIQLLCLSIIGAYLGKIFEEIKARPKYIIQQVHNDHREAVGEQATQPAERDSATYATYAADVYRQRDAETR